MITIIKSKAFKKIANIILLLAPIVLLSDGCYQVYLCLQDYFWFSVPFHILSLILILVIPFVIIGLWLKDEEDFLLLFLSTSLGYFVISDLFDKFNMTQNMYFQQINFNEVFEWFGCGIHALILAIIIVKLDKCVKKIMIHSNHLAYYKIAVAIMGAFFGLIYFGVLLMTTPLVIKLLEIIKYVFNNHMVSIVSHLAKMSLFQYNYVLSNSYSQLFLYLAMLPVVVPLVIVVFKICFNFKKKLIMQFILVLSFCLKEPLAIFYFLLVYDLKLLGLLGIPFYLCLFASNNLLLAIISTMILVFYIVYKYQINKEVIHLIEPQVVDNKLFVEKFMKAISGDENLLDIEKKYNYIIVDILDDVLIDKKIIEQLSSCYVIMQNDNTIKLFTNEKTSIIYEMMVKYQENDLFL